MCLTRYLHPVFASGILFFAIWCEQDIVKCLETNSCSKLTLLLRHYVQIILKRLYFLFFWARREANEESDLDLI
jgi:hypothetical protein